MAKKKAEDTAVSQDMIVKILNQINDNIKSFSSSYHVDYLNEKMESGEMNEKDLIKEEGIKEGLTEAKRIIKGIICNNTCTTCIYQDACSIISRTTPKSVL